MKRTMLLLLSAVALGCLSGYKTVEYPRFGFRNSGTLDVESIDITDSATILHIKSYYRPKQWIRIDSKTYLRTGADGEKLIITKSEGIPLDEEFYMPDSGEHAFTLYFPPIDPKTKKIDFIESDCEGCFKTYDIELIPSAGETKIPAITGKPQADEPYGANIISDKKATYKGRFIGYEPRYFDKLQLSIFGPMAGSGQEPLEIDISVDPDGSFSVDLDIYVPSVASIRGGGMSYSAYLEPGEETIQYIDLKTYSNASPRFSVNYGNPVKYIYNDGSLARINDDMEKMRANPLRFPDYNQIFSNEKLGEMSPEEYKAYINKMADEAIAAFGSIPDFSKKLSAYYKVGINAERFQLLYYYQSIVAQARMMAAKETDRGKMSAYVPAAPADDYYDFYNYLDLNNELNLANPSASSIMTSMAGRFVNQEYSGIDKALNNPALIKIVGSDRGPYYDIVRYNLAHSSALSFDTIPAVKLEELKKDISNPVLVNKIIADNQKIIEDIAKNKLKSGYVINETPNVPNEELLSSILAKYKGKVVFTDFWETWCGPCRIAMKAGEPVKEDFKGKDVVFLYIASESSPKPSWNNMIPDIKGEHFYLTNSQMAYLREKLGISGVPSYMLIDKEGGQKSFQVGFMGPAKMKSMIAEQL